MRSFGRELIEVHDGLRALLGELQRAVRKVRAEESSFSPLSVQTRCLTFCRALRGHHEGEDEGAFPALLDADPALRAVIEALIQDHDVIAPMLVQLQVLAERWGAGRVDDLDVFERELDGLAAVLLNHLGYEERTLVRALDALDLPADTTGAAEVARAFDGLFPAEPTGGSRTVNPAEGGRDDHAR